MKEKEKEKKKNETPVKKSSTPVKKAATPQKAGAKKAAATKATPKKQIKKVGDKRAKSTSQKKE